MEISSIGTVWLVSLGVILGAVLVWLVFCLIPEKYVKGSLVSKEIAFVPAGILGIAVVVFGILPYAIKVTPIVGATLLLSIVVSIIGTSIKSWFKKTTISSAR